MLLQKNICYIVEPFVDIWGYFTMNIFVDLKKCGSYYSVEKIKIQGVPDNFLLRSHLSDRTQNVSINNFKLLERKKHCLWHTTRIGAWTNSIQHLYK